MKKITLNKAKHVLAFERLEQEMEAICKEEQVRLIGGTGGYTWQQLADAVNSGNFNSVPSGSYLVNTDGSVSIYLGSLEDVPITATRIGGHSSGGYSSNGDNWGEFANCFNDPYGMNSPFGDGSGYSSGGYDGDANQESDGPTLSKDGKPLVDGGSIANAAAEAATLIAKADPRTIQGLVSGTSKVLGATGKLLGVTGAVNDGFKIWNKGVSNATAADWIKLGVSTGTVFLKANPYTLGFSIAYGAADMAGYNPVALIYDRSNP